MGIFDKIDKIDNKYDKITGGISGIGSNYESKYNQYNTKINKYKSKYGSVYDRVMGAIDGYDISTEGISNSKSLAAETKAESIAKINNSDTLLINTLDVINKNVARQNRFKILMTLPSLKEISFFTDTSLLDTYVQGASLPSQSLNLTEVRYLNKEYTASLFITTDTININFYDTKELIIRNMFLGWQTAINPIDSLSLLNYFPDSYKTSFKIYIHETGYEVTDVIPITVGDFVFDHNSTNSLGTFSVTFKVKKVKPII